MNRTIMKKQYNILFIDLIICESQIISVGGTSHLFLIGSTSKIILIYYTYLMLVNIVWFMQLKLKKEGPLFFIKTLLYIEQLKPNINLLVLVQ